MRGGDTLQSIAAGLWGDASLWYKLAEANGLRGGQPLAAGSTLHVPHNVQRSSFNASTFQTYNPADAIGDTSPTTPKPPKNNKCAVLGAILLVAVAVAVAVVTSGAALAASGAVSSVGSGISTVLGTSVFGGTVAAAGSVSTGAFIAAGAVGGAIGSAASQGVGVATGLQDDFSFKQVALAGIAGGVGGYFQGLGSAAQAASNAGGKLGGIGGFLSRGGFASGAARGALSSLVTQGIGRITGLQDGFSFAGVAAAGLGGGVSAGVSSGFGPAGSDIAAFGQTLTASAAGAIANAATRSALQGTNFGNNIIAAIPDVIGSTIGNALVTGAGTAFDGRSGAGTTGIAGGNGGVEVRPSARSGGKLGALQGGRLGISSGNTEIDRLGTMFDIGVRSYNYGGGDGSAIAEPASLGVRTAEQIAQVFFGFDASDRETLDNPFIHVIAKFWQARDIAVWMPALSQLEANNMRVSQTLDARASGSDLGAYWGGMVESSMNRTGPILPSHRGSMVYPVNIGTRGGLGGSFDMMRTIARNFSDDGASAIAGYRADYKAFRETENRLHGDKMGPSTRASLRRSDRMVGFTLSAGNAFVQIPGFIASPFDRGFKPFAQSVGSVFDDQRPAKTVAAQTIERYQNSTSVDIDLGIGDVTFNTLAAVTPAKFLPNAKYVNTGGPRYLTSTDFIDLPTEGRISPNGIRFSQNDITANFKSPYKDQSLHDFIAGLKTGDIDPASVKPIRLVEKNGAIYSLDNRRLLGYQETGLQVPYKYYGSVPKGQLSRFSTKVDGEYVNIRKGY